MPKKGVIPKQFLKNPPKSWSKKASSGSSRVKNMSKKSNKGTRKNRKRDVHLVPDILAIAAPADLLVESQWFGGENLIANKQYETAFDYLITNATTISGLKTPAVLLAGSLVAKYLGRKFGLNKIGTKDIKLF